MEHAFNGGNGIGSTSSSAEWQARGVEFKQVRVNYRLILEVKSFAFAVEAMGTGLEMFSRRGEHFPVQGYADISSSQGNRKAR